MFVFTLLRFKLRNRFTVTVNYSCFGKGIVCSYTKISVPCVANFLI